MLDGWFWMWMAEIPGVTGGGGTGSNGRAVTVLSNLRSVARIQLHHFTRGRYCNEIQQANEQEEDSGRRPSEASQKKLYCLLL